MLAPDAWLPTLTALAAAAAIVWWQWGVRGAYQPPRLAGEDGAPPLQAIIPGDERPTHTPLPGAEHVAGNGEPAPGDAAWPCFRGAERDNVNKEDVPLARAWPQDGPPVLWRRQMGQGHAGAAICRGRVYLIDYDEDRQRDVYLCLSLADGREIWRYSYPMPAKPNHGISRTVPAVDERFVVGIGPNCHVTCLDATSGAWRWHVDMVKQFGAEVPGWYTGQCALIDAGKAIIAPAGKQTLLAAISMERGEVLWKTPNIHGSRMSHASVTPMLVGERKAYVYAGSRGVMAVDAENGSILWETQKFQWHTIAPSPLPLPDGRILFTAGYGAKAMLGRLRHMPPAVELEVLRETPPRVFGSEMHTPIFWRGRIYAVLPKPRQELACFDLELNELWASGPQNRFGLGPYLIADGLLFILRDDGVLFLLDASGDGYRCLASAKVLPGPDAWGPMALAAGRLIVRDNYHLVCLDVRAPESRRSAHE